MKNIDPLPAFKAVSNKPIGMQIYKFLRAQIISMKILPGTVLSENSLSLHFNVSRNTIREGITRLAIDKLIKVIPHKGTIVNKISVSNLKEVCFLRSTLECKAIEHSRFLKIEDFKRNLNAMKNNLKKQTEKVDPHDKNASFLKLDDEFHGIICAFSRCSMMWDTIQSLKGNLDRIRFLSFDTLSMLPNLTESHREIYEAIAEQNIGTAIDMLKAHHTEILRTYPPIMKNNAEWFEESFDSLTKPY